MFAKILPLEVQKASKVKVNRCFCNMIPVSDPVHGTEGRTKLGDEQGSITGGLL